MASPSGSAADDGSLPLPRLLETATIGGLSGCWQPRGGRGVSYDEEVDNEACPSRHGPRPSDAGGLLPDAGAELAGWISTRSTGDGVSVLAGPIPCPADPDTDEPLGCSIADIGIDVPPDEPGDQLLEVRVIIPNNPGSNPPAVLTFPAVGTCGTHRRLNSISYDEILSRLLAGNIFGAIPAVNPPRVGLIVGTPTSDAYVGLAVDPNKEVADIVVRRAAPTTRTERSRASIARWRCSPLRPAGAIASCRPASNTTSGHSSKRSTTAPTTVGRSRCCPIHANWSLRDSRPSPSRPWSSAI